MTGPIFHTKGPRKNVSDYCNATFLNISATKRMNFGKSLPLAKGLIWKAISFKAKKIDPRHFQCKIKRKLLHISIKNNTGISIWKILLLLAEKCQPAVYKPMKYSKSDQNSWTRTKHIIINHATFFSTQYIDLHH